jgi:hypothetical protein
MVMQCVNFSLYFQVKESFSSSSSSVAEVKALAEAFQEIVSTNPNSSTSTTSSSFVKTSSNSLESSAPTVVESVENFETKQESIQPEPALQPQAQEEQPKAVENKEIQQENIKNALKEIISEIDKVVGSSEAEFTSKQGTTTGPPPGFAQQAPASAAPQQEETHILDGYQEPAQEYVTEDYDPKGQEAPHENGIGATEETQLEVIYNYYS